MQFDKDLVAASERPVRETFPRYFGKRHTQRQKAPIQRMKTRTTLPKIKKIRTGKRAHIRWSRC